MWNILLATVHALALCPTCSTPSLRLRLSHAPPTMSMLDGLLAAQLEELDSELANLRRLKNFGRRPNRIILVRHGESEGNVDADAYAKIPDSQIALTERGFAQGAVAGLQIRQLVGNETVRFFVSPYMRARQTLLAILRAFDGQQVRVASPQCEPTMRAKGHHTMECELCASFMYPLPSGARELRAASARAGLWQLPVARLDEGSLPGAAGIVSATLCSVACTLNCTSAAAAAGSASRCLQPMRA